MTLYTVWSGEYSDRCMHAIFKSREKAEKYCELHNKLDYDEHYIHEYEFYDDEVDMTDEVRYFWYADVSFRDWKNADGEIVEHKGEVTTDWMLEDLFKQFNADSLEDIDMFIKGMSTEELNQHYNLPIQPMIDKREVVVKYDEEHDQGKPTGKYFGVQVYSLISYQHARKCALDRYYEWLAKEQEIA